jgi:hypothetical protein
VEEGLQVSFRNVSCTIVLIMSTHGFKSCRFFDFLMVSMASDLKTLIKAADIMRES